MFGETLDYFFLRPLAHCRNIATEAELNARADDISLETIEAGFARLRKRIDVFGAAFPLDPNLRYLDMGCGTGELTLALAKLGCRRITGIDIVPRNIATCRRLAEQLGFGGAVEFLCQDLNGWNPAEKFDVLLSFDALEHIDTPDGFLRKMTDLVSPTGVAVLAFGPLFHSPFGDHQWDFYRMQLPWRGALFSEKAQLRVRRECFRPTDDAQSFKDVVGGMNRMRYSQFLRYVHEAGWRLRFLEVNPFLKRLPLHGVSNALTRIPVVKDFLVHSVYTILSRESRGEASTPKTSPPPAGQNN
jgi:SAM-dependent methyltransferase